MGIRMCLGVLVLVGLPGCKSIIEHDFGPMDATVLGDATLDTVFVFDDSSRLTGAHGTDGADICFVSADCAQAVRATATLGDGDLCTVEGALCATDRTDPRAVLSDACDVDALPSQYVSLGNDGLLAVEFDGDLRDCNVTIAEVAEPNEAYVVYVCSDVDVEIALCVNSGMPVHSASTGGTATFLVPDE